MRLRRVFFAFLIILIGVFGVTKIHFISASNTWQQTDWSDNSFSASSNVITASANQITLSSNSNWFNSSWKYRQSIGITNTSGSTLTDYQVPVFINTSSLISGSKMKNDCGDLRITDSTGNTLSYWISTSPSSATCNQTSTKVWVKVSSIPTSGTNLYLYYGNSSASSQSDGNNVFPIFADFTIGTSLPTGWTGINIGTSGTYSVGSSKLTITNTNGEDLWDTSYGATHVYKNSKVDGSFTAEALVTYQSNSSEWAKSGISIQNNMSVGVSNGQAFIIVTPNNGIPFQYQSSVSTESCNGNCIAPNINLGSVAGTSLTFPILLKLKKDSINQVSGYKSTDNGANWTQQGSTVTPYGIASSQYVTLFLTPHSTSATGTAHYAFFYTRKYSETEPSASTPSNEQKTYTSSGSLVSSIFDTGYASTYGNINFGTTIPINTSVIVKVRTSNNADMSGATDFSSCDAVTSNSDISSNNCVTDGHRYLQYQITLNTSDNFSTPTFNNISIQYSPPTFTVNFLAGDHGSITGTASQTIEYGNSTSSVTAVANSGYYFTNWSDGNTQNPREIIGVTSNKTLTANFAANDINAPVISSVGSTTSSSQTIINWSTDENSSSQVQYGLNQNYGFITTESDTTSRVTNHSVTLNNLKACARYYYRVISSDSTNNQSASAQKTFNTTGCPVSTIITGTESTLPTTGGTVQLINILSTAKIDAPNNYASQSATFQINKLDVSQSPNTPNGKSVANNNFYDLIAVTEDNQQLTTFENPVTFTISYGSDTENNFDESTLDVYKYDGTNWIKKNCSLNTTNNTLTCSLNGFSSYALLGNTKNNSSSSSSSSPSSPPTSSFCNNSPPTLTPDLFQINTTLNTAKLFFTPLSDTNQFYFSFSTKPNAEEYGEQVTLAKEGVQSHIIYFLKPNTFYYFKVRGQNGCMPGNWSNIMKIKTNQAIFYKNSPSPKEVKIIKTSQSTNTSIPTISQPIVTAVPIKNTTPPVTPISTPQKKCLLWWCW